MAECEHDWYSFDSAVIGYALDRCEKCGLMQPASELAPGVRISRQRPDGTPVAINGLHCVTDMHGRVYDWDDAKDAWVRRG